MTADDDEKNELIRKIVQVCASCGHFKGQGKAAECDRKKSLCHSKRVRRWLGKIEKIDKEETWHKDASIAT
jgi:hypothetical protein